MIELLHKEALYKKYLALFHAHRADPTFFPLVQSNTELTTVMGGRPWSWHVIGITPAALEKYKEYGFRHKSKSGITRAHLKPRFETTKRLLLCDEPYQMDDFFELWLENDKTVICASGENGIINSINYIAIENESYSRFRSASIGWRFTVDNEGKYLRELWDKNMF